MSDTVKIPRPRFERSKRGAGGRVEHDRRGNAVWVRTRADDETQVPDVPPLSLVAEEPTGVAPGPGTRTTEPS